MKYTLVSCCTPELFERKIQDALDDGWKFMGELTIDKQGCFQPWGTGSGGMVEWNTTYTREMIKDA